MLHRQDLGRRLAVLGILVLLALVRAERGLAELQGAAAAPSRMFRIAPLGEGRWSLSLLGFEGSLDARLLLMEFRSDAVEQ